MLIGIISDIHEDAVRLKQALRILEKAKVDKVVCLGDIVGYSIPYYGYLSTRDANEVVDLVRKNCSHVVIGNHDLFCVRRIPDHPGNFDFPQDWYDLDYAERKRLSDGRIFLYEENELSCLISRDNREYLKALPEYAVLELEGFKVLLTHYAYPDITGCSTTVVSDPASVASHLDFMERLGCRYGFSGNDHFEGYQVFTRSRVVNHRFETCTLPDETLWLHGPTVSFGTFRNGLMTFDSNSRMVTGIPLLTPVHSIPTSI